MEITTIFLLLVIGVSCYQNVNAISRSEVIDRAIYWERKGIPYSMNRNSNDPQGKPYRTDCSGYVSMTWRLPTSRTTVTLSEVSKRIGKNDLQAGDILLKGGPNSGGANGHVAIFHKWVDGSKNQYWGYEQTPPKTVYRKIPYPYFNNDQRYVPYRFNSISGGDGGDGGGGVCKCTSGRALGEYCGKQLTGACNGEYIYGCNKRDAEVSRTYGNCRDGCIVEGDGKSKCRK